MPIMSVLPLHGGTWIDDVLVVRMSEVVAFTVRIISPVSSGVRIVSIVVAFIYSVLMAFTRRLTVISTGRQSRPITTEIEF